MGSKLDDFISQIKKSGIEIDLNQFAKIKNPLMIDIREPDEVKSGIIPGAQVIPRGQLELKIEELAKDPETTIVVYCAGGMRSALAVESLKKMGFVSCFSLAGGIKAWKDKGMALEWLPSVDSLDTERYAAQMRLPQVGEAGQLRLKNARVLIIGAGGLGSPVAFYLAAAGVGTIGLIDDDVVDRSNLQRQILHTTDRVGMAKVDSAKLTLQQLNPLIKIKTYNKRLSRDNVDEIFKDYDIIVDGCDNFQTRYLVNDACLNHKKINVHGSVFWLQGQVSLFCHEQGPCYRCLYPTPPSADMAPNCAEAGVLGVLPGTIGLLEATEVIKFILGTGTSLLNRLLIFDALDLEFKELKLRKNPDCPACSSRDRLHYQDIDEYCTTGVTDGEP